MEVSSANVDIEKGANSGHQHSSRRQSKENSYSIPDDYANLDELAGASPIENPNENTRQPFEEARGEDRGNLRAEKEKRSTEQDRQAEDNDYTIPNDFTNLNELAGTSPVENPNENSTFRHRALEDERRSEQDYERAENRQLRSPHAGSNSGNHEHDDANTLKVSKFATQLYTISYLILFSILGTLARVGLQAITFYPGAPVVFSVLWPNVGGSLFMGFLSEDRMLFKEEWGTPTYHQQLQRAKRSSKDDDEGSGNTKTIDLEAAKKAHASVKKTIPLYVGVATGFCGSFTSFSSFIRDAFLALSNDLPTPLDYPVDYRPIGATTSSTVPRNGGYSFMALLAVIITTVALSISALHVGAHIAIATERFIPTIPFAFSRRILDPMAVLLGCGCWLGAVFLAIFPPDGAGPNETWRGRAVFSLVFAPLGCLGRFYASLHLNGRIASFPLGTFVVNILGTLILGMGYDLQHVPLGGETGCQVLQGIEDGFCGCLTTVSTWVVELNSLRRSHAYRYGAASVIISLCCLIVVMGSMQWTRGFSALQCAK
ncbi:CrcB-like protein-domain-containing protein [Amylocarpus encephaloides]|uniref:CrcB-like protein-domain-containing protein n=1 Tax=Amylocarpus encephaloides TaxID=45428 RepID=A0A9P8C8A4_9HELO|nr:CrcB-like protein-domain-containing protein [Amylocarpus encephaloides]